MGNDLASLAPQPPFVGYSSQQLYSEPVRGAIAAAGGTFDLPGPTAPFTHRVYEQFYVTSDTLAAPFTAPGISGQYLPAALGAFAGQTGAISVAPNPIVLAAGESFRLTNGSAAAAGQVWAPYFDIYRPNWTVVRAQLTAVAQSIIPAPAAGLINRPPFAVQTVTTKNVGARNSVFNADAAAHSVEVLIGGAFMYRTTSIPAGLTNTAFPVSAQITAASGALSARTVAAPGTSPNLFLVYETIAGVPP